MKIDLLDTTAKEDVRLEIIPLIDVIFCILTFFILAAVGLTRQQAIDLDLPTAQTGQPLPGQVGQGGISDRLYVSIDGLGQAYLDQQPVTLDLLYDVLLQFNQISPNGLIVLYASRDARYEDVVTVLDVLRSVGGDRVALATLPRDLNLSPNGGNPQPGEDELSPEGFGNDGLGSDGFETDPGLAPVDPTLPNDSTLPFEEPNPFDAPSPDADRAPEAPANPADSGN
ncbi:MAG: ExbD/TolR family protein [Nodosilinea sp.]